MPPVVRPNPYGSFNFLVSIGNITSGDDIAGGFSEVSGLSDELVYAEYRNGNDRESHVRKIPTLHKVGDVILKRGLIGDVMLFRWLQEAREEAAQPQLVAITLLDEQRTEVSRWWLKNAQPKKWIGPTLAAGSSGLIAIEELHLTTERIDWDY